MDQDERFVILMQWAKEIESIDLGPYFERILVSNPWFTQENVDLALKGVMRYLNPKHLEAWRQQYPIGKGKPKNIGIIMAGNLPLVGIHDFICTFASGHNAIVKLSRQDQLLLPLLFGKLDLRNQNSGAVSIVKDLTGSEVDAIIATGSDNTSRYIKYHFGNIPGIIRGNRSSVAMLNGSESERHLMALGDDVFTYFGRGCRNVSKLLIPNQYDFQRFITVNNRFQALTKNQKYFNNYRYQKSFLSSSGKDFLDAEYVLFTSDQSIHSALSVLHFQEYSHIEQLNELIASHEGKIQCIASSDGWYEGSHNFGTLQQPNLWDYSDNIDTMDFLVNL